MLHTFPILFFSKKSVVTYQKTLISIYFLSDLQQFFRSDPFSPAVEQRGLWEQRQGFLTAAAKREQQHLAEAEAEVLRHVAKLVPEAEAPKMSADRCGDGGIIGMVFRVFLMNLFVEFLFGGPGGPGKSNKNSFGETSRNP